jgi:transcriptional regulator with XRE-family HTH domain
METDAQLNSLEPDVERASRVASRFAFAFGEAMRQRRQEIGLRQGDLVQLLQLSGLQVTQGYISLLEAGGRTEPSVRLIAAIASLLSISLDEVSANAT